MGKTIKKITNVITTIVLIIVLVLVLLLAAPRVAGIKIFTILSGSMEPNYHVGSLIYVKEVDPFQLEEGDVITFMLDENTIATHRIVGVVPDENDKDTIRFRTKGDANDVEDGGLVHYKNVVGSPIFTIPMLGFFAEYIMHPPGLYIAISAAAIVLLLLFLPDLLFDDDDKKKEKKTEETESNS